MPTLMKPIWVKHDGNAAIYSIDIHPDNMRFATGGGDARVRIWNMEPILDPVKETGNKLLCSIVGHEGDVNSVRWSPDGKYLATASTDYTVGIAELRKGDPSKAFGSTELNIENWKFKHLLRGHEIDVWDVTWSPDGTKLASGGHNGKILIWNIAEGGKLITTLDVHTSIVKGLSWDPIGRYLASQEDTSVILWRTDGWKKVKVITELFTNASENPLFKRPCWSPDGGALIAVAGIKSKIHIAPQILRESWATKNGELVGHKAPVTVVHFNPVLFASSDGPVSCCALSGLDGIVSLWLTSRASAFCILRNMFTSPLSDMRWSPNGDILLMCSQDGTVCACIFNPKEIGRKLTSEQMERHITDIFGQASCGDLIENPDLWSMYQSQTKIRVEEQPEKIEMVQYVPIVEQQIETKSSTGRRRITPVCIQPSSIDPLPGQATSNTARMKENFMHSLATHSGTSLNNTSVNNNISIHTDITTTPPSVTPSNVSDTAITNPILSSSLPAGYNGESTASTNPNVNVNDATDNLKFQSSLPVDQQEKGEGNYYGLVGISTQTANRISPDKKRIRESETGENEDEELYRRGKKLKEEKARAILAPKKPTARKARRIVKNKLGSSSLAAPGGGDDESLEMGEEFLTNERNPYFHRQLFATPDPGDRLMLKLAHVSENISVPSYLGPDQLQNYANILPCSSLEIENTPIFVEVFVNTVDNHDHTSTIYSIVSFVVFDKVIWKERIMDRIIVMSGTSNYFVALGSSSGDVHVYSSSARHIFSPLTISSMSIAYLKCYKNNLLAVSVDGRLCLWDLTKEIIKVDTILEPLVTRYLATLDEREDREEAIILAGNSTTNYNNSAAVPAANISSSVATGNSSTGLLTAEQTKEFLENVSISENGQILVNISNGQVYCYNTMMATWTCIYDIRWQRKMDVIGSVPGPLSKLQQQVNRSQPSPSFTSFIHLTNLEQRMMNITHLEHQIICSELLGSSAEYKYWLTLYVQRLTESCNERKLTEICNSLLGPTNNTGYNSTWIPTKLGMSKRQLLQELFPIMVSKPELQRMLNYFSTSLMILKDQNSMSNGKVSNGMTSNEHMMPLIPNKKDK